MRELAAQEPDRLGGLPGPYAAVAAPTATRPILMLLLRASIAQGLVLYLFCVAPVLRPAMTALALALVVIFSSEGYLRVLGKAGLAAFLAIVSVDFASAYAACLTGGIQSPFSPWAAVAWIASLLYFRHARPKQVLACGATFLGLAVGHVVRPSPFELAPPTVTILLLACPLVAFTYMISRFLGGLREKGSRCSGQNAEQTRLEQLAEKAETADRRTISFFTEANHAIRTPLNAIIGYSEMILEDGGGTFNAENLEDVQRIQQATDQLLKLVSDVFDLSEIEGRQRGEEHANQADKTLEKGCLAADVNNPSRAFG